MFNSTTAVVRIDTWQAVLQNLTAGTVYRITVAAVNGAVRNNGLGMASTERTTTTLSCELLGKRSEPHTGVFNRDFA